MDRKNSRGGKKISDKGAFLQHLEIVGIILIALAVFMFCALLGLNVGTFGRFVAKILQYALGRTAFILPVYLLVIGLGYVIKHEKLTFSKKFFSILLIIVSCIGLTHYFIVPEGQELQPDLLPTSGGLVGGATLFLLKKIVGKAGALIILFAGLLAGIVLTGKFSLRESFKKAGTGVKTAALKIEAVRQKREERKNFYNQEKDADNYNDYLEEDPTDVVQPILKFDKTKIESPPPAFENIKETEAFNVVPTLSSNAKQGEDSYKFPPLNLLNPMHKSRTQGINDAIRNQSKIIEQTLADFGVRAILSNVTRGPTVTRFELAPAPGVKVSKIQNLSDDLALKLAVPSIRIEPIPGKAAIGLEVPSFSSEAVSFRSVVDCPAIKKATGKLCVGLGKDISGNVVIADLGKMPHLLVAGSTGSGKSVCINTIIASLLYKATPDEVKLILVDPKVVELTNYNGIPHLLTPVVTNAKQAASALHWAVVEMEKRYTLFAKAQVREINRYNETAEEKLPFIVIIIDELSDLMMVAAVDVEDAILRLAQKARAAGIHLILATQRPSVDVITGIVKANIPSRIAFAVSSQIDSRTILDMNGAEKLLGKGDMLFYPIGANKPQRVQGAYISDEELSRVVNFIKAQAIPPSFEEDVTTQELAGNKKQAFTDNACEQEDELFEDVVRLVMATQQASSSMLQRKFRIGYTRAARLVDTMEELGIISAADGSKPRTLKMSPVEIEERFFTKK